MMYFSGCRRALGLVLSIMILGFSGAVFGQSIVGTSIVDGKTITLYSDKTWDFENLETECKSISKGLSFCGNASEWRIQPKPTPLVAAMYRFSASEYFLIIPEEIGSDAGLTAEAVMRSVIINAAAGAGVSEQDVPVIATFASSVDGRDAMTISYVLDLNGTPFTYLTSVYLGPTQSVQFTTFVVTATELTDGHRAFHQDALGLFEFVGE